MTDKDNKALDTFAKIQHEFSISDKSLRDWFAGMAVSGTNLYDWPHFGVLAQKAYELADAMLKAREPKP